MRSARISVIDEDLRILYLCIELNFPGVRIVAVTVTVRWSPIGAPERRIPSAIVGTSNDHETGGRCADGREHHHSGGKNHQSFFHIPRPPLLYTCNKVAKG